MEKTQTITLQLSEKALDAIDRAADERKLSRSQFLINSALNAAENESPFPKSSKIMVHLTNLSELTNEISDEQIRLPIQEEVLGIWQSLN